MTEDEILLLITIDSALDLKSISRIMAITEAKPPSTEEALTQITLALVAARCRLATDVPSVLLQQRQYGFVPGT